MAQHVNNTIGCVHATATSGLHVEHCAPQSVYNGGWHTLRCPCADPRLTDYDTLLANIQDLQEGRATQVSQRLTAGQQLPVFCPTDELIDESPLASADPGAGHHLPWFALQLQLCRLRTAACNLLSSLSS